MDYKQRLAEAEARYAIPAGPDHPNQKFPKGARVKVADKMPSYMSHFPSGFEAVIEYSYAQKYGGDDVRNYSIIPMGGGSISWYEEDQLTLVLEG